MDATAAEMIRKRVLDLFVVRVAIAVQKDLRGHYDSVRAITALCRLLGDECLLQGVRVLNGTQSLQCDYGIVPNVPKRRRAGPDQIAADYRSAGPTLPKPATEFGPAQSEIVPQDVEQGCVGAGVDQAGFAVDCNASGHVSSPLARAKLNDLEAILTARDRDDIAVAVETHGRTIATALTERALASRSAAVLVLVHLLARVLSGRGCDILGTAPHPSVQTVASGSKMRDLQKPADHHDVFEKMDHLILIGEVSVKEDRRRQGEHG